MSKPITPKLIAVDCDGTFFDGSGHPSQESCEVMHRLSKAGHHVVAATGRSRFTAEPRLTCVPAMRYLVCSNGAYVWDTQKQCVLCESPMPAELVVSIADELRAAFADVAFNWESRTGIETDALFSDLAGGASQLELGGFAGALGTQELYKLKVRRAKVPATELYREQVAVLGSKQCEITVSGAPFTELSALGVTKAHALQSLATYLGLSAKDAIVFGDNHNDRPMFKWAGYSVAMGNATEELKAIADTTTLDNHQHGVSFYLNQQLDAGLL